jgi:hypothetical protein
MEGRKKEKTTWSRNGTVIPASSAGTWMQGGVAWRLASSSASVNVTTPPVVAIARHP